MASQPVAVVGRRAGLQELSKVVPDACGLVWGVVREQKLTGVGRNIAIYWDNEINLEIGVELSGPFAGYGEVKSSATPAGMVAVATHVGPYDQLHQTHQAIQQWCAQQGHNLAGPSWEIYGHWKAEWNNDPSRICTEVCYLTAGDIPPPGRNC